MLINTGCSLVVAYKQGYGFSDVLKLYHNISLAVMFPHTVFFQTVRGSLAASTPKV